MKFGPVLSAAVHAGVIAAGLLVPASLPPEPTSHIVIPIDLVTIDTSTNIAPVTEEAKLDDEAKQVEETENVLTTAAAKPEEDIVALPDKAEPPPPPKKEAPPSKAEAKPAPAKSYLDELQGILDGVEKEKPKASRNATADKAVNAAPGPPRMGAGDMRRMTTTITEYIRAQLVNKRCWTDHSDMSDARRLRTVFRVRFGKDGRFSQPPELIEPGREPSGDPPLVTFIGYARIALDKCNQLGWQIPPEYWKLEPAPYYIDLVFVPKIGAQ